MRVPSTRQPTESRRLALASLLAIVFGVSGCGDGKKGAGDGDSVSGKVTLNGQAVAGQVVFIAADGKDYIAPIGEDGSYLAAGVPKGQAKILVKGASGVAPKGGADMPGSGGKGVAPPAKYGVPGNGLTFDVTGGAQKRDIELTK
jgi:hypothetical protein